MVARIEEIAQKVASSDGLEVVEVELKGSGRNQMLRIYIDKPQGVTHADCEAVSHGVGSLLETEDFFPGHYTLEVSSPGLERKLLKPEDFSRFQGSLIKLQTFTAVNKNRQWQGRLTRFADGVLTIDLSAVKQKGKARKTVTEQLVEIPLANVEKANLVAEI